MIPALPEAVPEIPVSDIAAATAYYRDSMSFSVDWVAADIDLAGISRDKCRMFLSGPAFHKEGRTVSPGVVWLNLGSKAEVDELHRAWRGTNAVLLSEPESRPHGLHEFMAADPDGNLFRVFYDFGTVERQRERAAAL